MKIAGELINKDKIIFDLKQLPERTQTELNKAMLRINMQLIRYIRNDKLNGTVLNRRTGHLSNSISGQVVVGPSSVVGTINSRAGGQPLVYARIHEYGGVITPNNKRVLAFKKEDETILTKKIVMPARSYLRSSLADKAEMINTEINAAVKRALT